MELLNIERFGDNMKKAREEMKMSQKDLAEKVNLTPTTISAYEKKQKFPSLDNAVAIANIFGVSLDALCGVENTSHKPKTYSDIIQSIMDTTDLMNACLIRYTFDNDSHLNSVIHRVVVYYRNTVNHFLEEWEKVRGLYIEGTIDDELYQAWKEKKIREYDIPLYKEDGSVNDPMKVTFDTDPQRHLNNW